MRYHLLTLFLLAGGMLSLGAGELPLHSELQKLKGRPDACRNAMNSKDPILRRAAFRCLLDQKDTAKQAIENGMKDPDPLIRKRALYEAFTRGGDASFPALETLVSDPDPQVAATLIECAKTMKQKEFAAKLLKLIAEKGSSPEIRRDATKLVNFTCYRDNKRLKDNPAFDHEIITVKSIPLPLEGWSFRTDPMINGHEKDFFKTEFDDSRWKKLKIGFWEQQGYPGYDGVAWYRIKFKMPEKIDSNAVEIAFGAVDESAWVWLNGIYIGQHDIGTRGWDRPFALDVTREILWGKENTLVVRVEDTASAGGIWKPVKIDILK